MERRIGTKEKIELTALDLFSRHGYHAVSIRDISSKVGIKESSIYYHYENKQAIFDAMIDKINLLINSMQDSFNQKFREIDTVSEENMCEVAVGFFRNYLLNPYVHKMILTLSIERISDKRSEEVYQRLVFYLPLKQQSNVFLQMMKRGYIAQNDPDTLAREYYSLIYFTFHKYCISGTLTDEKIQICCNQISADILDLYQKMKLDNKNGGRL